MSGNKHSSRNELARRYARAGYDYALEQGAGEAFVSDCMQIRDTLDSDPQARNYLAAPVLSQKAQVRLAEGLANINGMNPVTARFLHILGRRGRLSHLRPICEQAATLALRRQGGARAHVESAGGLSEQEQSEVRSALENYIGGPVEMLTQTNPDLIGGVKIRIGSVQIDTSLSAGLRQLERKLRRASIDGEAA